ncbi:glutaredoxin family protein [Methanomethylovorans sp.]|uniref:glutaredoxin family protein n=1 Tax=Methanomethylovorans sp. TaxID=2758717 RepID=UPI00351BF624
MKKITMYTLSTCPWCKKAKSFFDEKHIPYEYIDYDKASKEVQEEIRNECKARGENISFPFVIIGDSVVVGYNPEKFMKLLES